MTAMAAAGKDCRAAGLTLITSRIPRQPSAPRSLTDGSPTMKPTSGSVFAIPKREPACPCPMVFRWCQGKEISSGRSR
jgi:hypothetical protein